MSAALMIDAITDRNNEEVPLLATSRSPDSICEAIFAFPDTIAMAFPKEEVPQWMLWGCVGMMLALRLPSIRG